MDARGELTVTYLDSSALMRLIVGQGDISAVEQALIVNPISSILASLEIRAVIYKQWHDRQITEESRVAFLETVEQHILENLALLDLDAETLSEASMVVTAHPVRTLDALHVATAMRASRYTRRRGALLKFVTADRRQAEAARDIFGTGAVTFVPPLRGHE